MKLSTRERYFVYGGIGVAILVGLIYSGDSLIPDADDISASLENKKRLLVKSREMLQEEAAYKAKLEQYKERLQVLQRGFLQGDNPSIAGAELQKVLADIAARIGVDISRKDIQKEQKLEDNLTKISVKIETNCQPDQLVQFIAAVQNYEKSLAIDELVINSFRMQKRYEIRPSLTVSGYIVAPEEKKETQTAQQGTRAGE